MRCQECDRVISVQALQVAMEQRRHFAMVRHAEFCEQCARKVYPIIVNARQGSRFWTQSMNCAYCGAKLPIIRIRFEMKDRAGLHVAVCQRCYDVLRPDLLRESPNLVTFIEKEWLTQQMLEGKRLPWPKGTLVKVTSLKNRYTGQTGSVFGFRCLVQPWFGYHVAFGPDKKQFFHERDLTLVQLATPAASSANAVEVPAAPEPPVSPSDAPVVTALPDSQPEPLPGPLPDFLKDIAIGPLPDLPPEMLRDVQYEPLPGMPAPPQPDIQAEPLPGLLLSLPGEEKTPSAPAPAPKPAAITPPTTVESEEPPPPEVPLSLPPAFANLLRPREPRPQPQPDVPQPQPDVPQPQPAAPRLTPASPPPPAYDSPEELPPAEVPLSLPPAFASMLRPRDTKPPQQQLPPEPEPSPATPPPSDSAPAPSPEAPPITLPDAQPDPLPAPLPDLPPGLMDEPLPGLPREGLPDFPDLAPDIRIVDDEASEAKTEP